MKCMDKIRVIIADDERPAREFLKNVLREFADAELIGEAASGSDAVEVIRQRQPDLALLDLQMPEMTGLDVVKLLPKHQMPLIAFVTAHDEYAVRAFEIGAVDYLLKPVEKARLRETLSRARERLEQTGWREKEAEHLQTAAQIYEDSQAQFLARVPVKKRDEIFLIAVGEIASIVADGELLHITTGNNERFVINFRLKDLEARLAPDQFVRLSRGALVNLKMIEKISPMPGGTLQVTLANRQRINSSRRQARVLRETLLKL